MLIKDLPIEIQEIVFQRQEEQGNKPDANLDLEFCKYEDNFNWDQTIEGHDFWEKINEGNYSEFYKKYPKKEESKSLVGRYLKILVDGAHGTNYKKDDYVKIVMDNGFNVVCDRGYNFNYDWKSCNVEVMPEGFVSSIKDMGTKFKPGDKVKIINRHPDNTTGSPPFNKQSGMIAYVCEYSDIYYVLHLNKDGSGDYYGLLNIKNEFNSSFKDSDLELIVEEPEINTYGLEVGNKLPQKVICKWANQGLNYCGPSKKWEKTIGLFINDRTIEHFKIIDGIVAFKVSNTGNVYLKAKGFKEFMDNFDKPKLQVNKWYKWFWKVNSKITYGKINSDSFFDSFNVSEGIHNNNYSKINGYYFNDCENIELLTDLSEIQQYLPEGHPDKVKVNENTDFIFEPGGYYVGTWENNSRCIFKTTSNKLTDKSWYIDSINKFSYGECCTGESINFRLASNIEKIWLNLCIENNKIMPEPTSKSSSTYNISTIKNLEELEEGGIYYVKLNKTEFIFEFSYYELNEDDEISELYDNYYLDLHSQLFECSPCEPYFVEDITELRDATEDEKKWLITCKKENTYIEKSSAILKYNLNNNLKNINSYKESKDENQSFKIKTKNSLLDTSIEKVPTITTELKQKSKTIKF